MLESHSKKRPLELGQEPSSKRIAYPHSFQSSQQPSNQLAVRALVSYKDAGVIIGKGGKTVLDLKEQTRSQIVVSSQVNVGAERILTVTGTVESMALAFALIAQKIAAPATDVLGVRLLVPNVRMVLFPLMLGWDYWQSWSQDKGDSGHIQSKYKR